MLAVAHTITNKTQFAFFTTVDKTTAAPQSRLIQPFPVETDENGDISVHIGTHIETRKVEEVQNNSRVCVAYHDKEGVGYVVLKGNAYIEEDTDHLLRKKY